MKSKVVTMSDATTTSSHLLNNRQCKTWYENYEATPSAPALPGTNISACFYDKGSGKRREGSSTRPTPAGKRCDDWGSSHCCFYDYTQEQCAAECAQYSINGSSVTAFHKPGYCVCKQDAQINIHLGAWKYVQRPRDCGATPWKNSLTRSGQDVCPRPRRLLPNPIPVCPCGQPDCQLMWACFKYTRDNAAEGPREACDKVAAAGTPGEPGAASKAEEKCCWGELDGCRAYNSDCFNNITRVYGYFPITTTPVLLQEEQSTYTANASSDNGQIAQGNRDPASLDESLTGKRSC
jgi:hypothetical protein